MNSFDNPSIKITGIVFQNKHGSRYYSNYYLKTKQQKSEIDLTTQSGQSKFQQGLLNKITRMNIIATLRPEQTEIFSLQGYTVLFKIIDELQIYLIVNQDQNFVLMESVINTVGQVLLMVTKGPFTGKIVFDYLHDIALVADEIIHQGYIVCLDANKIYDRIKMKDSNLGPQSKPVPKIQSQQQAAQGTGTFTSLFGFAKNTFNRTLNLG